MSETIKPIWYSCVPVKVERVVLERTGKDNEYVFRVRLETDLGDITYKPKVKQVASSEVAGFEVEDTTNKLLTMEEFILENKMLVALSKNTKKNPQELILGYAEIGREDDNGNVTMYKYMVKSQFDTIYYSEYHKDDSNLKKQEEKKKKYAETDLGEE